VLMARNVNRRRFIKGSLAVSAAQGPGFKVPTGKIRHVEISRLICGGNLIIGSAHDRDLTGSIQTAIDNGAFIHGGIGDNWVRNSRVDIPARVGEFIKTNGWIATLDGIEKM